MTDVRQALKDLRLALIQEGWTHEEADEAIVEAAMDAVDHYGGDGWHTAERVRREQVADAYGEDPDEDGDGDGDG